MKTIEISWTEVSQHRLRVRVPDGFDTDTYDYDLENQLGELDAGGLVGVERTDVTVRELPGTGGGRLEEFDPVGTPW